jgi:hypothetical protein
VGAVHGGGSLIAIELWRCEYPARCKQVACTVSATVIARYVDGQGRTLHQFEYCEKHARVLARTRPDVKDMREPV